MVMKLEYEFCTHTPKLPNQNLYLFAVMFWLDVFRVQVQNLYLKVLCGSMSNENYSLLFNVIDKIYHVEIVDDWMCI
jgi:hypothetical protein